MRKFFRSILLISLTAPLAFGQTESESGKSKAGSKSQAESDRGKKSDRGRRAGGFSRSDMSGAMFDRLDSDKDGTLSKEEFKSFAERLSSAMRSMRGSRDRNSTRNARPDSMRGSNFMPGRRQVSMYGRDGVRGRGPMMANDFVPPRMQAFGPRSQAYGRTPWRGPQRFSPSFGLSRSFGPQRSFGPPWASQSRAQYAAAVQRSFGIPHRRGGGGEDRADAGRSNDRQQRSGFDRRRGGPSRGRAGRGPSGRERGDGGRRGRRGRENDDRHHHDGDRDDGDTKEDDADSSDEPVEAEASA